MRKVLIIIGFVLFAIFYCFAVEKVSPVYNLSSDNSNELTIEEYSFVAAPSANLVGQTFHSRTINKSSYISSFASCGYIFEECLALIEYTEKLFASKFAQYSSFSLNFLIEKKKSNLTFPFYYFW